MLPNGICTAPGY